MTMYISPLVDVNEIDLSTTIPAVATAFGVIILRNTWKGSELKVKLVNSIDEMIEEYGRPEAAMDIAPVHEQSYEDLLAGCGFLQFGENLYCTRVLPPSATFAGLYGTITALGSSSSSSSTSSCTQGWIDTTGPSYWNPESAPEGSWNDTESRYEAFIGENWAITLTNQDNPIVTGVLPSQIRLNLEILSGYGGGDLTLDILTVTDKNSNTIYSGTPTISAFDTPEDIILTPTYVSDFDIDTIEIAYQPANFYIHSIEIYEDCGISSSSSSSSSLSSSSSTSTGGG